MVGREVEAIKIDAYHYLIKPFHIADMVNTQRRAAEMLALRARVQRRCKTPGDFTTLDA